jgi:hypothetical protein
MYPYAIPTVKQKRRGLWELFYITPKYHGNVTPSKIVPKTYFKEREKSWVKRAFKNEAGSLLFLLGSYPSLKRRLKHVK